MEILILGKILCLFTGLMYTGSIFVRALYKNKISAAHFVLMAAGWTGFITLMWLI